MVIDRVFGGRYRLTEKIGIGGMAEVYKATDEVLGRTVAVKVMLPHYAADPTFATRFKQEAQAAANLQSPYIVNIYDWGFEKGAESSQGTYYIVMEYVRGTDLKTAIEQRGAINQRKVAEIGSQVCSALSVAHGYDIIHRDIKPHNIMVQPDGNTKVMDFGIARMNNANLTQTGSVLGTAYYVSPEQAQGKQLSPATDIYSLGVCLYEATTGHVPFEGPDPVSIAVKQVNEEPIAPRAFNPKIDPMFEAIILRAMAKDPNHRFTTADEMRIALNDYLAGRLSAAVDSSAYTQVIVGAGVASAAGAGAGAAGAGAAGGGAGGERVAGAGPTSMARTPIIPPTERTAVMPTLVGPNAQLRRTNNLSVSRRGKATNKNNSQVIAIVAGVVATILIIAVAILIAQNPWGTTDPPPELITVPQLVGKTEEDAKRLLLDSNLVVGEVTGENHDTVPAGTVIRQNPGAASKVDPGTPINFVVSVGLEMIIVPDLYNKTVEEAISILVALKLNYTTRERADATIPVGRIVDQSLTPGDEVKPNTVVILYVSRGPDTGYIPVVTNMKDEDAAALLFNEGFDVAFGEPEYSDTVPKDFVISQDRRGTAQKGVTVTLIVSKGPEPPPPPVYVNVPNLFGMTLSEAQNAVNAVGLGLAYTGSPGAEQTIVTQSPSATISVEKGTTVTVTFTEPAIIEP